MAELVGTHACRGGRLAGCRGGVLCRVLAVAGDMARLDAGALDDPLVGGIDPLGELGIGDAARRQRGAGADDDRAPGHCAAALVSPWAAMLARSSVILRVKSSRTMRAATRIDRKSTRLNSSH